MEDNLEVTAQENIDPWDNIDLSDITDDGFGADQPEPEEAESSNSGTDSTEVEEQGAPESGTQPEAQPEIFELKHLDSVQNVDRQQVIALAQKGLDYDRKFAKYEEYKSFRDTHREAVEMLQELANRTGVTPAQMLSDIKLRQLMDMGLTEAGAKQQIDLDNRERVLKRREEEREKQETQQRQAAQQADENKRMAEEKRRADIQRFMQTFPTVKPDDIPKEVWAKVQKGEAGLTEAYALHEAQRLNAELEAAKRSAQNRQRSTGSRDTAGQNNQQDEFTRLWYMDD